MEKWQAHPAHDLAQWACSGLKLSMTMSRPVFSLSDAARLTGVSRSTMRRYREGGDFPNAYKNTDKVWMIPVEDLLAKGLKLQGEASTQTTLSRPAHDQPQAGSGAMPNQEVDALKAELAQARIDLAREQAQREGVENVLAEVRKRADSLDMALRQLEAGKPQPKPTPPPPPPAPKGWWARLWAEQ